MMRRSIAAAVFVAATALFAQPVTALAGGAATYTSFAYVYLTQGAGYYLEDALVAPPTFVRVGGMDLQSLRAAYDKMRSAGIAISPGAQRMLDGWTLPPPLQCRS